ncbi:MAG: DUF2752 domain-containing protein [Actinomycetota bacterium]|nr:DUF2752 domain-containing protein [Actinomycetota bacterium]
MASPAVTGAGGRSRAREIALVAGVGIAVLVGATYLSVVDPHEPGHYPTCPTLALTGLYCAGCGALRAVHGLTRLDLAGAWDMNPLVVLAVPVLGAVWFAWARRAWVGRPRRAPAPAWVVWSIFALVVGYSVLRNVPALAPWLAP